NVKPGSFSKSTNTSTPVSQGVTGLGFRPKAVLLASYQDVTEGAVPVAQGRIGIGATDGTTEGCSAFSDTDVLSTTSVDSIDKTSKVSGKANNDPETIDAAATPSSLDADGFTLSWKTNDAVATEICYLALGSLSATEARLASFTAEAGADGVRLDWKTDL